MIARVMGCRAARATLHLCIALIAFGVWVRFGPIDSALLDPTRHQSITIVDRNGVVLYESLSASGTRTDGIDAARLPGHVVAATVAAEDRRFFSHPGVDPIAIGRALVHNVRSLRVVEGGSTLTQQVAKLLLQSERRTLAQKVRGTILALRLERRFNKQEILAMYLNLAPYGNRISGAGRASRTYFGCAPEDLTVAQAAYLAALPQRPGAFNPLRDPSAAIQRQRAVLAKMRLSLQARNEALAERLSLDGAAQPLLARHFVERVLESSTVKSGRITTTLDAELQRAVVGIIGAQRSKLIEHHASSVAVAVLDNRTGGWLAWEGSGDYFGKQFGGAIDGVVSPRQPGSTLKPFTYALAFENGHSPATVVADVPSHFPTNEEGVTYTPRNYDGKHRGPMRIRYALAGSQNVPAVAMLSELGPAELLRFLRAAGFTTLNRTADYYGLGLTLGDAEVRLDELVKAYSVLARGGVNAAGARVISPRTAFWISDILSDADAREYAFGSGGSLDFPFRVAVKTGTSQAYRDNWTVGYTRDVTVGVWVGNFSREELHNSSGVTGAAPIFNAVMLAAMQRVRGKLPLGDDAPIVAAKGVETVRICALSGSRPSPYCPATESEWLATDDDAQFCSWHHDGYVDLPPEYHSGAPAILPAHETKNAGKNAGAPLISNPPNGATYLIDPTLRASFQKLRLQATAPVAWNVNGKRVSPEWTLTRGRHTITAVAHSGRRESVTVFVR